MINHFRTISPSEALRDYVACYYFIKSSDENFTSKHYSFPHTFNALSLYKDSEFESQPPSFTITHSLTPNYLAVIQAKRQGPIMVNISGKIDRATILFKDFGINHFIDEPLSSIMAYGGGHFNSWSVDPLFTGFVEKLFNVDDNGEKGKIIDHFLSRRLPK